MNQLRETTCGYDTEALRVAAGSLALAAQGAAEAAERLQPIGAWRGPGAQSATAARQDVAGRGHAFGDALAEAAGVVRRCADDLDHAARLRAQATALVREDTQVQQAAERARAVLRAAATTGPPLPPYTWDAGTALLLAASRYAAEADELEELAVRRAVAALDDLRPVPRHRRSRSDHVVGFGRGAWSGLLDTAAFVSLMSPSSAALDLRSWWSDVRGAAEGAAFVARHPREGLAAALGLDQLRAGAYGEWLGGMAAGIAMPQGRGTRVLGATRVVDTGGPVRLRPGVAVPAGFPARIADLEPDRRVHILEGDHRGGGHRSGAGKPRKSEFPPDWADDEIIDRVMQVAMRPDRCWKQDDGRFVVAARRHGVLIHVVLEPDGRVVSGFPLEGPGVVRNPRRGAG